MTRTCLLPLSLLLFSPAWATDPPTPPAQVTLTAPKTVTVEIGRKIVIEVKTTAKKVTWKVPFAVDSESIDNGKRLACWASEGTYRLLASVPKGEDVLHTETVLVVTGPRPPPTPPVPPDPVPPTPVPPQPVPPQPVTSFRVIWVTESAATLTPQQNAICNAKSVRDYETLKCTKEQNWPDYRNYDPQTNAANDYEGIKALWAAVKPKLTVVPCLVIELNGKADIIGFPKNADEALAILKKYYEGK